MVSVYLHMKADTREPFYVGLTTNDKRPNNMAKRDAAHKEVVARHGVEVCDVASEMVYDVAAFWEVAWIKALRAAGFDLTNKRLGGSKGTFGKTFTDETRQRMSVAASGKPKTKEHAAKVGAKHKGKTISAATREKMSAAKKGVAHDAERRAITSKAVKDWWARRKSEQNQ